MTAAATEGPAETVLLLPAHGLDDLPEVLPEPHAAASLNAFALAWHPALLSAARSLPRFVHADRPPRPVGGRRFLLPDFARDLLPDDWEADAAGRLAVIPADRGGAVAAVERIADRSVEEADLAPFRALGLGHLWVERLTRRTHYYSTLDETRLRTQALAAADALLSGDRPAARQKLVEAAEVLLEARERFYPTPAAFCELCLVLPRLAGAALEEEVNAAADPAGFPLNLLATGAEWQGIAEKSPALIAAVKAAAGRVEPVGGGHADPPALLRDAAAVTADLSLGRETLGSLFGRQPGVWGSRGSGFGPLTPQLLGASGFAGALHLNFGPGELPGDGAGRVRWTGAGGEVSTHARAPVKADGAAGFWRLPEVLADAFEAEQTVAVTFARWPGADCPYLDDLKTLTRLSPALGEFRTYEAVFAEDDPFARRFAADPKKYRSNALAAALAAREPDPIASHAEANAADAASRADSLLGGLADLLAAPPGGAPADRLAAAVTRGGGTEPGTLWLNPLPVPRTVGIEESPPPAGHPAVRVVGRSSFTFELPPGGFAWFPDRPIKPAPVSKAKAKTADAEAVRNERFEVLTDPATGGIAGVKTYGRSPVRLALQPAVRFAEPRPGKDGDPVWYTRAVRLPAEPGDVADAGPARGVLTTRGTLRDPAGGAELGRFALKIALNRGARTAAVTVSLTAAADLLKAGTFCVRWAWDDEAATFTRSVQGSRQPAPPAGTIEAPHWFELETLHGSATLRTAVLTPDAPFHIHRGPRMLDTPLLVAGETVPQGSSEERTWRFGLTVDDPHPMRSADLFTLEPRAVSCVGPPAGGPTGWLFAVDRPNVRVLSMQSADGGVTLRLQESDGANATASVRFFRPPTGATKRSLGGEDRGELACEGDAVRVALGAYELCDVAVRWG